jgi:hypothetical protein
VTSEVSGIEDKSGGTGDAPSDGWVPSGGSMTGNAVIQGIEVGSAGRAITRVGDVVEDESSGAGDAGMDLMVPNGRR